MSLRWPVLACPDVFTGSGQPVLPAPVQPVQVVAPAAKRILAQLQFGYPLASNWKAVAYLSVGNSIPLIIYLACQLQEVDRFF